MAVMRRTHHHVGLMILLALLIGASLSGGPVVWAVIIMLSPFGFMLMLERSVHASPSGDRRQDLVG
jgi:hypothetical protein